MRAAKRVTPARDGRTQGRVSLARNPTAVLPILSSSRPGPRWRFLTLPKPPTKLDLGQFSETNGNIFMATRDNQTQQIILIVFILLSILMSVGLVMVNNARKTAVARAKDANEKASEAQGIQRELQSEASNYKLWIGYAEADTYQTLETTFKEDMQRWGSTFDESSRAFRTILENIFEENRKLAQSEADAKGQVKEFSQKLLAIQAQTDKQIATYQAESQAAQADKEKLRNEFEASREQINTEKEKIATQLADQRQNIDALTVGHSEELGELQKKITGLQRVIEILKSNQTPTDPYAQPADGRIAWVNQREGKVWINLGAADQLRPQVTFSVYSGDTNDVNAAQSKGSIEVVRILSPHMAEARITDDKAIRPLMEGDKVYSQVWNRGRQIGFAITGIVDLDGDGTGDIDQLKRIIQLNNGKVDAVPGENGDIEGEMTVDTRYLILGKHPEDSRDPSKAARDAFQKMSAEADTLNIEVITLDDFLRLMGWQSGHRAVQVGKGARRSEDFPARAAQNVQPPTLNSSKNLFRQRKPLPSY